MFKINEKRLLDSFIEFIKIDSPSLKEKIICDTLKSELFSLGAKVIEDNAGAAIGGNAGNIIADFEGNANGKRILLSAHMDSVEPCCGIKPAVKDGIIYSEGATILGGDDKAGIAAILEAIRSVKECSVRHAPFQVVFTVSEEIGKGCRQINRSLLNAECGYVFDADGSPGQIIVNAPGSNIINARIYGKSAHAGIEPEKGASAILAAGQILSAMPAPRIDDETTCNIGTIVGGTARNIVPDYVELKGEVRSRNAQKLHKITNDIKEIFNNAVTFDKVRTEVDVESAYESFSIDSNSEVIKIAVKAAEKLGLAVDITSTGGGSDANWFNLFGIPTALMGVGMKNVHTKEEYISKTDLYNTARYVVQILAETAETY